MKIIRTVLGDIPADQIGATDAHDHLVRSGGPEIKLDPAFLMDDVEAAKKYKAQRSHIGLEDLYDFQEKIR